MITPLSNLKRTSSGIITSIEKEDVLIKLLELGVMPGVSIIVQNKAPFNGPLAILVNGIKVIIRKKEAKHILIEA